MPSESSAISAPSTALRPKGAADGFQIWQHALLGKVAELTRALAEAPAGSIDYKGTRNWTPLFAASARASEKAAKEAAAATKVQAIQRGNVAREQQVSTARERAARIEAETHAKAASEKAAKEAAAATKVQAIQRGNVAREQQVSTARERAARIEAETHAKAASEKAAAATKVQAVQRGNVARQAPHARAEGKTAAEKEAAEARAAADKAAAETRAAAVARAAAEEAAAEAKLVAKKEAAEAAAAVTAVGTVNALPDDSWIKAQVSRTGSPARRASPRRKDAQEAQLNQVMYLVMDEATELATRLTQEIADLRGEMAALKAASAASNVSPSSRGLWRMQAKSIWLL
ncbi:hypothetical protein Ctob_001206 [Chrysochromulina tobinii]|uniref:Uncharacterized protein n=1 Tax=Chrysochromulina tobinii TaxID=1460289 RepID=A0A0M0JG51_9EUKA|nr:hypothetical protein Ctob_001206 [Chrysochromulina tobinii]|eukprot:KOO25342.1 hypothetical protein Ctob_001206 [Chrysochromulina sp. CCMP291]